MAPHAENETASNGFNGTMTSEPTTNGGELHSQFLSHLTSYPLVSDGITTYKSNPYGAKSIDLFNSAYTRFDSTIYKPISPYLATPYSLVVPYLTKLDSLGDSGLSFVDSKVPVIKEDTATLKGKITDYAGYPFKLVDDGKRSLLEIYGEEFSKYEKQGYGKTFSRTRALVDTDIRVIAALVQYGADWLLAAQKKAEETIHKKQAN
jgi:hypothetical protein